MSLFNQQGKVLYIDDVLQLDSLAAIVANRFHEWEGLRSSKLAEWNELLRYVYATDTTQTSVSKLPWSNKTTLPKLCQIADNLHAIYMAALFPKSRWLEWEGTEETDEQAAKKDAIESYMQWAVDRPEFKQEASRLVWDYILFGNVFAVPVWQNDTSQRDDLGARAGFIGPSIQRISPLDIVFNPTASSFAKTPKVIRSLISLGELSDFLEQVANSQEEQEEAKALFTYLTDVRGKVAASGPSDTWEVRDSVYNVAGFSNFRDYLLSGYVEMLTFYGDIFNAADGTFTKNAVIRIVDRHKVISKTTDASAFASTPIFHSGWRMRPDNLWAMGPLDNLVGLQYRMDHVENMKADAIDLSGMPVFKIKGVVEDFDWKPLERIYIGDDGDVQLLHPPANVFEHRNEIQAIQRTMEEMAGLPKESLGFRTPGEKTAFEVETIATSGSRLYQAKAAHLEFTFFEPLMNGMLELARRYVDKTTIRAFDDEFKIAVFSELTNEDISGNGRLRPVAARNFAEKANLVQSMTALFNSSVGADVEVRQHFSSLGLARMMETILDIEPYNLVSENIRLIERAQSQRIANSQQEQLVVETQTPSGFLPGDFDPSVGAGIEE